MDLHHYLNHCNSCNHLLSDLEYSKGECFECGSYFNKKQRNHARRNPEFYTQDVVVDNESTLPLIKIVDSILDMEHPIIELYGIFAITNDGIDCLSKGYDIPKTRLNNTDLREDMLSKTWVNISDFDKALERARKLLCDG